MSRRALMPRMVRSSTACLVLSAVALAGCGAGGSARSEGEQGPDRLAVTLRSAAGPSLRIDLECAVADREACRLVLSALADAQDQAPCAPRIDGSGARALVAGVIDGEQVRALAARRTDCEALTYDRIISALGR